MYDGVVHIIYIGGGGWNWTKSHQYSVVNYVKGQPQFMHLKYNF